MFQSGGFGSTLNRLVSYLSEFVWSKYPAFFGRVFPTTTPYCPRGIQLEVTTKCNLRCKMCPNRGFRDFKMVDMPMETYVKAIRQSLPELEFIYLWGVGEPLLNPNFIRMVKIAKRIGAKISFSTNGTFMDEDIAKKIVGLGVDEIVFSMDSANPRIFEKIRHGAKFERVTGNLERLLRVRNEAGSKVPRVSIATTLLKMNLSEMTEMVNLAHRLGVPKVWFQNVISWDDFTRKQSLLSIRKSARVKKVFKRTKKLADQKKVRIRLPELEVKGKSVCRFPWFGPVNVRWDGTVTLCPWIAYPTDMYFVLKKRTVAEQPVFFEPLMMGNIHDSSLKEIWNNEKYQHIRELFKKDQQPYPCNLCLHQYQVIC